MAVNFIGEEENFQILERRESWLLLVIICLWLAWNSLVILQIDKDNPKEVIQDGKYGDALLLLG